MSVAVLLHLLTLCLLPEPKKLSTYSHTCIKSQKNRLQLAEAQYVNSAPHCNHRMLDIPCFATPPPVTYKQTEAMISAETNNAEFALRNPG